MTAYTRELHDFHVIYNNDNLDDDDHPLTPYIHKDTENYPIHYPPHRPKHLIFTPTLILYPC